tara:strand:- start:4361 stop:4645 length:285 start_codon:yes stop_codon:yes gene_type:complete
MSECRRLPCCDFSGKFISGNRRAEKSPKGTFAERAESLAHILGVVFPEHVTGTVASNVLRTPLNPFDMKRDQAAPQGWLVEDSELSNPAPSTVL